MKMLQLIKNVFSQLQVDPTVSYKLTLYMSFSPCSKCSMSLATFAKSEQRVQVDIMFSKLYFHKNRSIQKGLRRLKHEGVSLKVMDKEDFQTCLYLFVDEHNTFQEWTGLHKKSEKYSDYLRDILDQVHSLSASGSFYSALPIYVHIVFLSCPFQNFL
ncbi:AICDA deaminase, partial [Amia calva]|nr:AICDA deaminase [Amia calva]